MLLDWLTLSLPLEVLPAAHQEALRASSDRIQRYCPATGEVRWESSAWESVRSDSHQLAVRVGSDALHMQGSPARCMGDGDTVFGSLDSLEILLCARAMVEHVSTLLGIPLPSPARQPGLYKVSRVDVTGNCRLDALSEVRQSLSVLRDVEGGRYRVSQQAGDTVYWSHRSRLRSGKAYAKGPHLRYLTKRKGYTGRSYTDRELSSADCLLRLELRLGAQYWRERAPKRWHEMEPEDWRNVWSEYFERMVGESEVVKTNAGFVDVVKSAAFAMGYAEGSGQGAFGCWTMIQALGWEQAREQYARRTWYRYLKILRAAGLGDADLSAGRVVELRRERLVLRPVTSWAELLAA